MNTIDLNSWRQDVLASPLKTTVVAYVKNSRDQIAKDMLNANLQGVPQFAATMAASTEEERRRVEAHLRDQAETFVTVVENDFDISYPDYDYIVSQASSRARQTYPLAAQLHSYRIGQRVCWTTLCSALTIDGSSMPEDSWRLMMSLSVFTFEYVNHISTLLADAYNEHTSQLERTTSSARAEFVDRLLRKPDDPSLVRSAPRFNLDPNMHYLVVVARRMDAGSISYEQLTEIRRPLETLIQPFCKNMLIEIRRGDIIFILATDEDADRKVERTIEPALHDGLSNLKYSVGISATRPGLGSVAGSYEDALSAVEQTSLQRPVVAYNSLSIFDHLLNNAGLSAYRMKPAWIDELIKEDKRTKGALLETLSTYINCRMSAKKAASELNVHTNTVYQRISKIEHICSRSDSSTPNMIDILVASNLHARMQ